MSSRFGGGPLSRTNNGPNHQVIVIDSDDESKEEVEIILIDFDERNTDGGSASAALNKCASRLCKRATMMTLLLLSSLSVSNLLLNQIRKEQQPASRH